VTVLDTSGVVDLLLEVGAVSEVERLLEEETAAAPDVLVFEVLAVLRRHVLRGVMPASRAQGAVEDLGDLGLDLVPTLPFRQRAWELRDNISAADALFVALAEHLDEPLATKDGALAVAVLRHSKAEVVYLGAESGTDGMP
jgi:predicted nucleic acid-binding protein